MSIERAPSTVSLVLAQVQRVEPKPPIFLLSRFGVCAPSAAAPSARRRHVDWVAYPRTNKPMPNIVNAQTLPIKATPKADIGILSQLPASPTSRPKPSSAARLPPRSPARIASAAAMPGGQVPGGEQPLSNIRWSMNASSSSTGPHPPASAG